MSLGSDGQILSQGTISDALAKNKKLKLEVTRDNEIKEKAEGEIDGGQEAEVRKEAEGKLIVEEESGEGHISWESSEWYIHRRLSINVTDQSKCISLPWAVGTGYSSGLPLQQQHSSNAPSRCCNRGCLVLGPHSMTNIHRKKSM